MLGDSQCSAIGILWCMWQIKGKNCKSHHFMVVSKACLSLWRTRDSFGHEPACLARALHTISCHGSLDKGLAMKPQQKQSGKSVGIAGSWADQSPRTRARGGGCSPGPALLYSQKTLQTLLMWELVRETMWIGPVLNAWAYSEHPIECCKMYETYDRKFSYIPELKAAWPLENDHLLIGGKKPCLWSIFSPTFWFAWNSSWV